MNNPSNVQPSIDNSKHVSRVSEEAGFGRKAIVTALFMAGFASAVALTPPTVAAAVVYKPFVQNSPDFDTDGDGLTDDIDTDDDNDGIPDINEYDTYVDTDCDRIYDSVDASNGDCSGTDIKGSGDSDNDGVSDAAECPLAPDCRDADLDGVPDYMDPDDDNDGILTVEEGVNYDADGDYIPDRLEPDNIDTDGDGKPDPQDSDDDGDGVPTSTEVLDLDRPADADQDGIPDYLDLSDGDGSGPDILGSGDSDGDGVADGIECPMTATRPCPDTDGDAIPDYMDADTPADGSAGCDANTGGNTGSGESCSGTGSGGTGSGGTGSGGTGSGGTGSGGTGSGGTGSGGTGSGGTGSGGTGSGGTGSGGTGSGGTGSGGAVKGDSEQQYGDIISGTGSLNPALWLLPLLLRGLRRIRRNRGTLPMMLGASVLALNLATPGEAVAQEGNEWYVGIGAGATVLKPDTRRTPVKVTDDTDYGYKIFAGRELSDHVSVEGFWADLGSAEIGPGNVGHVDYNVYGASLQVSLPENNPGFSTFIKGGVVGLNASSNLPHHTDENFQVYGGAGAEYQMENGYTVRGEYEYYTKDSQLLSLSVIKRFGGDYEELTEESTASVRQQALAAGSPISDRDHDGVADIKDRCPATPDGAPVNEKGCPAFVGVMEGIQFDTNSTILKPESRRILDRVAEAIKAYPGQKFVIVGHTDNVGSPAANKKLSIERAKVVARYLVLRGVPASQLRYGGYGAAKPRATNSTPEGRAKNRRVEILMAK